MRKTLAFLIFFTVSLSAFAAQPPSPAPLPDRPPAQELTPQVLGEMLRTATTFHELVTKLDPGRAIGPDQHVLGPDGQYHHPVQRTAAAMGAGAGAGAAIGAMTRGTNGVLIGALIGGAGGLIVDQILCHRKTMREKVMYSPAPETGPEPRQLQPRYQEYDRRLEPNQ